jgi:mono/diheme cytochrome c family protein
MIGTRLIALAIAVFGCVLSGACGTAQTQDAISAGEEIYDEHCATCHGEKLRSTGAMPDLKELPADARSRFDQMVMGGRGQMPAWQGIISREGLDSLWAYIRSGARR